MPYCTQWLQSRNDQLGTAAISLCYGQGEGIPCELQSRRIIAFMILELTTLKAHKTPHKESAGLRVLPVDANWYTTKPALSNVGFELVCSKDKPSSFQGTIIGR